jgi:hypothetical protein
MLFKIHVVGLVLVWMVMVVGVGRRGQNII